MNRLFHHEVVCPKQ